MLRFLCHGINPTAKLFASWESAPLKVASPVGLNPSFVFRPKKYLIELELAARFATGSCLWTDFGHLSTWPGPEGREKRYESRKKQIGVLGIQGVVLAMGSLLFCGVGTPLWLVQRRATRKAELFRGSLKRGPSFEDPGLGARA